MELVVRSTSMAQVRVLRHSVESEKRSGGEQSVLRVQEQELGLRKSSWIVERASPAVPSRPLPHLLQRDSRCSRRTRLTPYRTTRWTNCCSSASPASEVAAPPLRRTCAQDQASRGSGSRRGRAKQTLRRRREAMPSDSAKHPSSTRSRPRRQTVNSHPVLPAIQSSRCRTACRCLPGC